MCQEDISYMLDNPCINDEAKSCKLLLDTSDIKYPVYRCIDDTCYSFAHICENYLDYGYCRWYREIKKENMFVLEDYNTYKYSSNFKLSVSSDSREHFSVISDIITEFKTDNADNKDNPFHGYFCFELVPGSGCNGAWDEDVYLYIKSNQIVYKYMLNDSSCNYFNDYAFKRSCRPLNKLLYEKEREFFKNYLPRM